MKVTAIVDGSPPRTSNQQIARFSRDAIATRLKQAPKQVTISYVLNG